MTAQEIKAELDAIKQSCDNADDCARNIMKELRESKKRINRVLKQVKNVTK